MSYLVLARKFRPQCFDDVVGQQAVVRTLQNGLNRNRVPHALIFSGVRGVGKTTLARIMAKALNCAQGPSSSVCNACKSCREITSGASVDLHEVDGASNRGIQEIRDLKEKIRFMPTGARFKVFIIDEVHMLTTEAFNALLKTLEEPPDHVYFMLATTELHRVPVTILSRCQRYELKRVGHAELSRHFAKLAEQEKVVISPQALALIVREAGGSVRDGLSLLDQVFSYCGEQVDEKDVVEVLGLVGHAVVAGIASSLLAGDLAGALDQLERIYDYGMDLKRFVNDVLNWFRSLVICKVARDPGELLDVAEEELALLQQTASGHTQETLMMMFHSLLDGLEKATYASHPRFAVEMAFIQAVQVGEVVPADRILSKLDMLLAGTPLPKKKIELTPPPGSHDVRDISSSKGAGADSRLIPVANQSIEHSEKETGAPTELRQAGDVSVGPNHGGPVSSREKTPPTEGGVVAREKSVGGKDVRQHWNEFIRYVKDRKRWMASSLERATNIHLKNDELVLHYVNSIDCRLLRNRDNIKLLTEFALDFFQQSFQIRFDSPDPGSAEGEVQNDASPQKERQSLANDPLVLTALDVFNGQVGGIRVGPRFRTKITEEINCSDEPSDGEDEG